MSAGTPDTWVVRITTAADEAVVARLLEASYPALMTAGYEPGVLGPAMTLLIRPSPALLGSGTFFVAETGEGTTVGCGGWTPERPGKGDVTAGLGHIRHFAIDPAHTGRGVGRSLYNACASQARVREIERFECYASLNAEGFYAALGFERIEPVVIAITDEISLPAIRMIRSVGNASAA